MTSISSNAIRKAPPSVTLSFSAIQATDSSSLSTPAHLPALPTPATVSPSTPTTLPHSSKPIKTTSNQLLLKLDTVSIVYSLSLAKLSKAQIASLREFKVYGGLNPTCTHELAHTGFYADDKPETFSLRHTIGAPETSVPLPVQYLKIVPGTTSKPSSPNTWVAVLRGINDSDVIQQAVTAYTQYKENEVFRLCLKHFRKQKLQHAFDALLQSNPSAPQWEHPLVTEIFNSLVNQGNFEQTEKLLQRVHDEKYFEEYLSVSAYTPHWERILPKSGDPTPGMRGGHQMCIDEKLGQIFLFGGWDGSKDLSDFWVYHIAQQKWELLCPNVEAAGGPGPRSCHKICFDEKMRRIYTLGRYVDSDIPTVTSQPQSNQNSSHSHSSQSHSQSHSHSHSHSHAHSHSHSHSQASNFATSHPTMSQLIHAAILPNPYLFQPATHTTQLPPTHSHSHPHSHTHTHTHPSTSSSSTASSTTSSTTTTRQPDLSPDFYYYDVDAKYWVKLSSDTYKDGGPQLIFDHQMVVEPNSQVIYVFGGKAITNSNEHYSGLYEYSITGGYWSLLREEEAHVSRHNNPSPSGEIQIRSRIGHSMLFNPKTNSLYIFAGQRSKDYLSDFFEYKIGEDQFTEIMRDSHRVGGPEGGFTQRATFDASAGEIYVLSGLMRERHSNVDTVKNSFWVYHVAQRKWRKIYQNENTGQQYWLSMQHKEPRPRFAHQLVYHSGTKEHFMFGGNPGESDYPYERLDDFWSLKLERPTPEFILSRLLFFVRKQQFYELCGGVKDEMSKLKSLAFLREKVGKVVNKNDSLATNMFNTLPLALFEGLHDENAMDLYDQRYKLFEEILGYFPASMRPPCGDLKEYID